MIVRGPDATSFLQSLISQDLDPVPVGASVPSLLLQPQGKVLVEFVALHAADDEWRCVCEGSFGAALADGLNRFKIRVKAEIECAAGCRARSARGAARPDDAFGCDIVTA